ncbi:MAG: DUF47 family protein [Chitinophagaceae bacterium]|nr:DUF47 family protein [Chitinophagaceae bacterium]MBP8115266.1 DUF47 family protein [Chitinophagaceae bacterium]HQZ78570.1 DUF47 family protein [Bacteroidia bacterium]
MGLISSSKKEDSFITQLKLQAEKTEACLVFLLENMDEITDQVINENRLLINELIDIKMLLMDDLHNTFITPIDREDIYQISTSLFGMAKYSLTTIEEMQLLNVKPDRFIREMVEKVKQEAHEIFQAISRLMKNPRLSYDHIIQVIKLEAKIERIYRDAVKELFDDKNRLESDLQAIFHLREVYRHISNMSDKAEAAADALGIAVIKLS